MVATDSIHTGHRERLRRRFLAEPDSISETELLELLLTYAIPRRDVAPLAVELMDEYGSLEAVLSLSDEVLSAKKGMGETAEGLLQLVYHLTMKKEINDQPPLFGEDTQPETGVRKKVDPIERKMRILANNEVENALALLPKAVEFRSTGDYQKFLIESLPYNSFETRRRRASYMIERYFPTNRLDTPLAAFLARQLSQESLKAAVFYHMLKAEQFAAEAAEELVYPALPLGKIERDTLREFMLSYFPYASLKSQRETQLSFFTIYRLCGVGSVSGETLRFSLRNGDLDAFAYIFSCEFPEPGIYSFDQLFNSPVHRWMLWDREWIRRQLYNLLDLGILAKVSEIDAMRQFTLVLNQADMLRTYFSKIETRQNQLRERSADEQG